MYFQHVHCNAVYCLRVYMEADFGIRFRIFIHSISCFKEFAFAGEKSRKISARMLDRPSSPVVLLHLSTMRNKHTNN